MDRHPSPQSIRFTPFQTTPAQFLRNIGLRTRARIVKKKPDPVHTVANAVDNRPRAHSAEILRKPTALSTIPGYRLDDASNPTDTDESSQDASPCDTSHPRQLKRHSTSDRSCFASAYSAPSASCPHSLMDQTVSELEAVRNTDAASSLLPNASAGTIARSANEACSQVGSAVPSQHVPGPGLSIVADQTPLPPETTPAASPSSVMQSPQGVSLNTPSLHLELTAHRKAPPVFVQGLSTSAPFQAVTECGARLSPVITPRQPLPVLDLPPFSTSSKEQASVRGVPSLSVHGRSSADHAANHDAAYLSGSEAGESDEGDELEMGNVPDAHQSDESDEEAPCAGPSTIIHRSPAFETHSNANSTWSSGAGPSNSPSASRCVTVVPTNLDSKSFSKSVQFASPSPSTLSPKPPRVEASGMSNVQDNAARRAAAAGPSCKTDSLSELRPSLYRIASRSMIDFGTNNWGDRDRVSDTPSISGQTAETTDGYDADVLTRRFRRCSIPNYHHPTSDPPPYPSFSPRPKAPREGVPALVSPVGDETRERLPAYSNSLYLMAVMPRKMEFVAPGVQAKDRKWRRVLCELEGTVFRVYKCPPGASGAGILGDWWERQVGVGDVVGVVSNNAQSQAPAERSTRGEPQEVKVALQRPQTPPPASGDSATREGSGSNGLNTGPSSRAARRASGASFLSSFRSAGNTTRSGRSEQSIPNRPESRVPTMELLPVDLHGGRSRSSLESINHNSESPPAHTAVPMPPPRSASRLSFLPSGKPHHRQPNPSKCDLIRAYTLQNAESGLGNDYTKRRNVIRVRVEGEQFLLQAPDVPSVVEWIEALHAGTNIALDLDQRTMPRGPMFPRRRRRRNRRPAEASATSAPPSTVLPL